VPNEERKEGKKRRKGGKGKGKKEGEKKDLGSKSINGGGVGRFFFQSPGGLQKNSVGDSLQEKSSSDAARHNRTCGKSTARPHVRARAVNVR
jgi:hypothetical protein